MAELPTGDTVVCRESFDVAMLAARAALQAVETCRLGAPVMAAMRPPGHHAEPARGMGFCIFNNLAIAAAWARKNIGPVLIVDFDYHHGNGTQAWVERAVQEDGAEIGFISTHAYPAYPGTGAFSESQRRDNGFVVDIPLPHTTATEDFLAVWSSLLPALARHIEPKIVLVSAGFDFLAGDPIAGLPISLQAVDGLCGLLTRLSEETSAPLALIFEGGYNLDNLRASGEAVGRAFSAASSGARSAAPMLRDARLAAMVAAVVEKVTNT